MSGDVAENGSCWDEAPSMLPPQGQCAPMPARCQLKAGHLGAHKSGRTEWMRNPSSYRQVAQERDDLLAEVERLRATVTFKQGQIEDIARDCETAEAERDRLCADPDTAQRGQALYGREIERLHAEREALHSIVANQLDDAHKRHAKSGHALEAGRTIAYGYILRLLDGDKDAAS